jgi:hypothetical protein
MFQDVQETRAKFNEQVSDWYHQGRSHEAPVTRLNLANLYDASGQYAQARPLYQQAGDRARAWT